MWLTGPEGKQKSGIGLLLSVENHLKLAYREEYLWQAHSAVGFHNHKGQSC